MKQIPIVARDGVVRHVDMVRKPINGIAVTRALPNDRPRPYVLTLVDYEGTAIGNYRTVARAVQVRQVIIRRYPQLFTYLRQQQKRISANHGSIRKIRLPWMKKLRDFIKTQESR